MTSWVVQVSSSFSMGVDGTALSVSAKGEYNVSNNDDDTKGKNEVEKEYIVEAFIRINHNPLVSRVPSACSSSDEGFLLHFLRSWFRSQRQYSNSKLAQLFHVRISNQKYFRYLGNKRKISHLGSTSKNQVYVAFVSACPGWVGTHILRSKIAYGSWRERFLRFCV